MAVNQQITLDERVEPWDRQPSERKPSANSSRVDHYELFDTFRMAGPSRQVSDLANEYGKSPAYLKRLAWANRWWERARAWDALQREKDDAKRAVEKREADNRRGNLGKAFAMVAAKELASDEIARRRLASRLAETAIRLDASVYGTPDKTVTGVRTDGTTSDVIDRLLPVNPETEERARAHLLRIAQRLSDGDESAYEDLDPAEIDVLGDSE